MRYLLFSTLLAAIVGCASVETPVRNNEVNLVLRDHSTRHDFLLAVRDSSVVVAPYTSDDMIHNDSLLKVASVISFSDISAIYHRSAPTFKGLNYLLPSLLALPAAYFGALMNTDVHGSNDNLGWIAGEWALGSFAIVTVIEFLLNSSYEYFDLNNTTQLARLREHAIYPAQEPPSLQVVR